jgi:hypothetical protein
MESLKPTGSSTVDSLSRPDVTFESTKRCLFPEESDMGYDGDDSITNGSSFDDENSGKGEGSEQTVPSPTSVVNVLADLASSKSTMIVMSDEGAEVELQDATNVVSSLVQNHSFTPNKNKKNCLATADSRFNRENLFPTTSLLDVEKTPMRTPPHIHPQVQLTPSTCACFGCDELGQAFVERAITTFLEEPSVGAASPYQTSCTDWQAWSYFFGIPNQPRSVNTPSPSKENIRSVLRQRASQSLRTRKSAVRQLSRDLAPFGNSPARSPARGPSLFRNRSFSVSDHRYAIVRVSKDGDQSFGSSITEVLHLCTMPENTTLETGDFISMNPNHSLVGGAHDSVCYDSDPEEFTRRRRAMGRSLAHDMTRKDELDQRGIYPPMSPSPRRAFMDVHNDEVFSTIVQEIFNQTTTLVFHRRSSAPPDGQAARPVAIDAWLERGQNLAHSLIQPKWMWKPKPRELRGNLKLPHHFQVQAVELLDVTRILKLEDVAHGRDVHSFAKTAHCFVVKTIHGEEYCFEALNVSERDRLVFSLKLVIARFGAKVLVGDRQLYGEFFSMADSGVPGNAPDIYEGGFLADQDDEEDCLWRSESSDMSNEE